MAGKSLNILAGSLAERMEEFAERLRVGASRGALGETLLDCGAEHRGGIEAGQRMAEICLGGLGNVTLAPSDTTPRWPWHVVVRTSDPVTACLGCQYAGWGLDDAAEAFTALGSGPARALARREVIFDEIAHREEADRAVLVLETDRPPPAAILGQVAEACGVAPERLTVLFAPTGSLAGSVQVVARVVEVAVHKAHMLSYPLDRILDAIGSAPLPPPHPDHSASMGRTNDAIIFGGRVQLFVSGPADEAKELAENLPSFKSRDYGAPFATIFKRAGGNFHALDPMLFSPALVAVTAVESGETFRAGTISADLLDASFG